MRILILDDDMRDMPHFCDLLRQSGHDVKQIDGWNDLCAVLMDFKPDGIIVDLMIPAIGLPVEECAGGYTSGAYIYITFIHELTPNIPFIVFSAATMNTFIIQQSIANLKKYSEFRGVLSKGCEQYEIIDLLTKSKY